MNLLRHLYAPPRNLFWLTICLPKLLTVVALEGVCFAPLVFMGGTSTECMSSQISLPKPKLTPRSLIEQVNVHGWTWQSGGAACGLCFGLIAPLIGSVLTAITWFTGPRWHGFALQRAGMVLLFLTIPLLAFGAHCLDLLDQQEKNARKETR
jgi:hypothetical protein